MSAETQLAELRAIIESEQRPIGDRAEALVAEIRRKHGGAEKALLFYGSSLRAGEASGKMLDFYVLVDSYRDVHGFGLKQLGSFFYNLRHSGNLSRKTSRNCFPRLVLGLIPQALVDGVARAAHHEAGRAVDAAAIRITTVGVVHLFVERIGHGCKDLVATGTACPRGL